LEFLRLCHLHSLLQISELCPDEFLVLRAKSDGKGKMQKDNGGRIGNLIGYKIILVLTA
jgi:hypothetical protein